ncbi:ABC transporter ATP-binding protein [Agrobacterium tumefaciens]|uniref:ABC transporter ATP-binding protein n=1 Tax=Agrobacterium tumefaciens TaxID=358 RepID=UPI00157184BC|nr:ABC transporter ATP-binding protein [Agrobacterium tumefaciens]NTE65097.1 ABC transporter ATP-binding protein [Agrobacterium tumefaciens]
MRELVRIEKLSVGFREGMAVCGIDLVVHRGETVGLIGESGSGKSVTWLGVLGLLPPTAALSGRVLLDGQQILGASADSLSRIRGKRIAMIFQDAASALNPVHTVGRQVVEALRLHRGMEGAAARAEAKRLFDLVGIPDAQRRLKSYPHELSGGQNQRVMIAMALAGQPDLLIADEPTTALDVTIQAQILDLLRDVQRETGMALVFISHDLGVIAKVCSRAYVMYAGRIVEAAHVRELFTRPRHPYTRGLLGALPRLDGPLQRLAAIPGTVPGANARLAGCDFAPRCTSSKDVCGHTLPELIDRGDERLVACLCADHSELAEVVA